jgi:hypothetical protein
MSIKQSHRSQRVLRLCAALMVGGLTMTAVQSASAADLTVRTYANIAPGGWSGWMDIPGATVTLHASPGQKFVLWNSAFNIAGAASIQPADVITTNTALMCGPPASGALELGAYYAPNWAPVVGANPVSPALRWVFTAPAAPGTVSYTCKVAVNFSTNSAMSHSYSMKVTSPDGTVTLKSNGGYGNVSKWTLPDASSRVSDNATVTTLGSNYAVTGTRPNLAVRQDLNVTGCRPVAYEPDQTTNNPCANTKTGYWFSDIETWVEVQPLTATGASCGAPIVGPKTTKHIVQATHHWTAINSLNLATTSIPASCRTVRLSAKVRHYGGDRIKIEAGLTNGLAATHSLAFEF